MLLIDNEKLADWLSPEGTLIYLREAKVTYPRWR